MYGTRITDPVTVPVAVGQWCDHIRDSDYTWTAVHDSSTGAGIDFSSDKYTFSFIVISALHKIPAIGRRNQKCTALYSFGVRLQELPCRLR